MQPVHPMSDGELDAHVADLRTDWRVTPRLASIKRNRENEIA